MLRRMLRSVSFLTVLSVLIALGAYQSWLALTAPGRIGPNVLQRAEAEGTTAAVIHLPFKPERFHIAKIQEEGGRIRKVDGNAVELRSISADGIRSLARRYYWIDRIDTL